MIDRPLLDYLRSKSGDYASLLNRRSRKLRDMDLDIKELDDVAIGALILSHYSLLKRPILLIDDQAFIGNSKSTVESAKGYIASRNI